MQNTIFKSVAVCSFAWFRFYVKLNVIYAERHRIHAAQNRSHVPSNQKHTHSVHGTEQLNKITYFILFNMTLLSSE